MVGEDADADFSGSNASGSLFMSLIEKLVTEHERILEMSRASQQESEEPTPHFGGRERRSQPTEDSSGAPSLFFASSSPTLTRGIQCVCVRVGASPPLYATLTFGIQSVVESREPHSVPPIDALPCGAIQRTGSGGRFQLHPSQQNFGISEPTWAGARFARCWDYICYVGRTLRFSLCTSQTCECRGMCEVRFPQIWCGCRSTRKPGKYVGAWAAVPTFVVTPPHTEASFLPSPPPHLLPPQRHKVFKCCASLVPHEQFPASSTCSNKCWSTFSQSASATKRFFLLVRCSVSLEPGDPSHCLKKTRVRQRHIAQTDRRTESVLIRNTHTHTGAVTRPAHLPTKTSRANVRYMFDKRESRNEDFGDVFVSSRDKLKCEPRLS